MRKECPVCTNKNTSIIKKIRFTLPKYFHLPDGYEVVACNKCGFCYAATEATVEDYDYYYSHCNFYSGVPTEVKEKTAFNHRAVDLITILADKNDLLLDIGFGKGAFMRLLKEKGFFNVYGMDPSKESVEAMRQEGFTVFEGSIFHESKADLKDKFHCLFLFDVLEHLLYPDKAIEKVADYLKENGYLVISVPNYAALFEDHSLLIHQFNQEHINYFSPVSLDNLLGKYGFYRVNDRKINKLESTDNAELLVAYCYKNKKGGQILKDEICQKSIIDYVSRNDQLEQVINEKVSRFCDGGNSVYVWGTGAFVMWLLANTKLQNINIEAFIDNNPTKVGKELIGKPIISAENIKEDVPILICAMRYSGDIVSQIKSACIQNKYLVV